MSVWAAFIPEISALTVYIHLNGLVWLVPHLLRSVIQLRKK